MHLTEGLDNVSIDFYSIDGSMSSFDVETNETGHLQSYVPVGDWHVVLHQELRGDYFLEMQELLNLSESSDRTDLVWNAVGSTNVSINLTEAETDVPLVGYTVTAVSNDGLRNVSIGPSDANGIAEGTLTTGEWTFFLNRSTTTDRWLIEEGDYVETISILNASEEMLFNFTATKTVLIGGMIFWDLDGNGIQNNHEGIPDVHVEIVSDNLTLNLTTDADGVWKSFAPILTNYSINVSKEGFTSAQYEEGINVNSTHISEDLALTAGNVSVSGEVTHLLGDISILSNTTVELYPIVGRDLEMVVADVVLNGTMIEWNAEVTPGDWAVWAIHENAGESDYSVAIGMLNANVSDGGTVDVEMSSGGWISITSEWNDFQIQQHHIGETEVEGAIMNGTPVVELDLGDGIVFELPPTSDGTFDLLLPSGTASFSVSFSTNEMGMEMNYSGGVSVDVVAGVSQAEKTMTASRPSRHDITFEIVSVISGAADIDEDDKKSMTAIEKAGGDGELGTYQDIIIEAKVTYSGNQANSIFALTGDAGALHDSQDWNITFLSNETADEWNSTHSIELGLGENLSAPGINNHTFRFKIQLPSQDIARSYDDNHSIGITFKAGSILAGELGLEVHVPQRNSIRLDSVPEGNKIGVPPGGETAIDIELTNLGNGEDTVRFELDSSALPEGWSATPSNSTIVLSSNQSRPHSFTIHAPSDAADGTYSVFINTTDETGSPFIDEEGNDVEQIEIEVSIARANLKVLDLKVDGEALYQQENTITVVVQNIGTLDAEPVDLTVEVSGLQDGVEASAATTISVPAGETVTATVQLDLIDANLGNIELTAYATTTVESVSGGESGAFTTTFKVNADAPDEPNKWLPWIIIGVILVGIYAGMKAMAARRGPKF